MNTGISSAAFRERQVFGAKRRAFVVLGALLAAGMALTAAAAEVPAATPSADVQADAVAVDPPSGGHEAATMLRPAQSAMVSHLDRRVALLARELDLDAIQQLKVKALLESQREQVSRVWSDESVPGALRVKRTQAVSERTEEGIRSLLTDEQKSKYFKPRPADVAPGGTSADLATWMDKVNGR